MRECPFTLKVDNIEIRGAVYVPEGDRKYPGLIISHGIPAGVQDPHDRGYPWLAERFCSEGFLTAIFNFRGCGLSGGNFHIRGWMRDLKAVVGYLWGWPGLDRNALSLMGFSAGAAASVYVGARDSRVTAVVSCSCPAEFEHFRDVQAARGFLKTAREIGIIRRKGFPPSLPDWMGGFAEVAPVRWVAGITPRPLLILHGSRDELIPVEHAWELHRAAGEPKQIHIIKGAGHRLRPEEEAIRVALDWLKRANGSHTREDGLGQ
ncbi:MAG: prolyl oligopeptidase family serine peptidase [Dehalococcoidia bacterium]|nr:prolyl oligopeptidase family serine peptidase [Dehalococcoidia bacterium]